MNIKSEFENVKIINYHYSKLIFENTANFFEVIDIFNNKT